MNKTKIEWCDATWNPVTGCLHGCEYCYARRIAERFGLPYAPKLGDPGMEGASKYDSPEDMDTMLELEKPYISNGRTQPYPMAFLPTFHRYKLDEPQTWKKPQTIFVCSMADLFGEWVPDAWIEEVFAACQKAPQHRYLFLTKNPARYLKLAEAGMLPQGDSFWYGSTVTGPDVPYFVAENYNVFLSVEPLMQPFGNRADGFTRLGEPSWFILGAMTGPGSTGHQPEKAWVDEIVMAARSNEAAVYMKDSLIPVIGESNMVQEFRRVKMLRLEQRLWGEKDEPAT